jgi:hypothetical protein
MASIKLTIYISKIMCKERCLFAYFESLKTLMVSKHENMWEPGLFMGEARNLSAYATEPAIW